MGTVEEFRSYMEQLATELKLIGNNSNNEKRFASYPAATLASETKLDLNLNKFCLVLLKPEARFRRNQGGQTYMRYETGFYIVKNAKTDSYIEEIQLAAESIAHKIWARILNDWHAENTLLAGLETDRADFPFVYELNGGTAYGCECAFTLKGKFDRENLIKPEDWN